MTIEPLRRETHAARGVAPVTTVRTTTPTQRRAPVGHMCVVVTDLADGDGQVLVANLRRRGTSRVVLLARRASRRELVGLLTGGLRGAVATESGHTSLAPGQLRAATVPRPTRPRAELTARELSVLAHVADGRSNRVIGEELGLSALTVKSHLARISRKLGTGDRAALVAIAIRTGLLP